MNDAPGGQTHARTLAREVLAALDAQRQIAPFSTRAGAPDFPAAYAATAELRRLRTARGEKPAGRKIGFTNRAMWAEYGIDAPFWGDMYDTTMRMLADGDNVDIGNLLEPKIEPEIAFRFARAPRPGMDEAALAGCLEWVAHGFEIVHTIYPGWKFAATDGIAGGGLHAVLLLGKPHPVEDTAAALVGALATFEVTLKRNGEVADTGSGANVLESPLSALRHLVTLLANDTSNPPLAAGEIVTTGSLTRALPVAPGERWSSEIRGLPIDGISASFS